MTSRSGTSSRIAGPQGGHDAHLHGRRRCRSRDRARRVQQPRHPGQDRRDRRLQRHPGGVRLAQGLARHQARSRPPRQGGCRSRRDPEGIPRRRRSRRRVQAGRARCRSTLFAAGQMVDVQGTSIGKGFTGTIKRHNFSSQRASHGNSRSHNVPGSISMAQDPGRVFPGKKMSGHLRRRDRDDAEPRRRPRRRSALSCCWCAAPCRARRTATSSCARPSRPSQGAQEGSQVMQLELLNEQGQATSKVDAPDTVFARDYNEALVHQIVVAFQANARQGTRAQKDRATVKHSTKKPWRQKGTGRARAGMTSSPLWRGGGRIFPNSPDENFTPEGQQEDVPRRHGGDPVAAGPRRPPGGGRLAHRRLAQDQAAGAEVQGHGPGLGAGDRRPGRRQPAAGLAQPGQRAGRRAALRRSAVAGASTRRCW